MKVTTIKSWINHPTSSPNSTQTVLWPFSKAHVTLYLLIDRPEKLGIGTEALDREKAGEKKKSGKPEEGPQAFPKTLQLSEERRNRACS